MCVFVVIYNISTLSSINIFVILSSHFVQFPNPNKLFFGVHRGGFVSLKMGEDVYLSQYLTKQETQSVFFLLKSLKMHRK